MKSLTHGLKFDDKSAAAEKKPEAQSGSKGLVIAGCVACLLISVAFYGWTAEWFTSVPTHNGKKIEASGEVLTPAQQKQIDDRKKAPSNSSAPPPAPSVS